MSAEGRGQGSLEFLMTYGWVLITVLVALVVMWQWGLFGLGQRVEPGSFGFWGLAPLEGNSFILHGNTGQLEVSFLNTVGANITVMGYNATIDQVMAGQSCPPEGCAIVKPDGKWIMQLADAGNWGASPGSRFDATVTIIYRDNRTADNIFQSSGRIWGSVEP